MQIPTRKTGILAACATLALIQLAFCCSVLFESGISPYDDLLFANNGMFFLSAFHDVARVISGPKEWMWNYYNQYPALFLRRHPPLFGMLEAVLFAVVGPTLTGAKLLTFGFAVVWALAWFALLLFTLENVLLALAGALAIATLPMSLELSSAIRVDVPSAAFLVLACVAARNLPRRKSYKAALATAALLVASLYTYQLSVFGAIALVLTCALSDVGNLFRFKRNDLLSLCVVTFVLMLPLAAMTLLFAQDNLAGIATEAPKEFAPFIPVKSPQSLAYWLFYLEIVWEHFPLAMIGLGLWVGAKFHNRIRQREVLFIIWFVLGYIGLSFVPSKGDRYAFHFVGPAFALGMIGIRELLDGYRSRLKLERSLTVALCAVVLAVNIQRGFLRDYEIADGLGAASEQIMAEVASPRILYCGALSPLFIYEVRRRDPQLHASVLRCDSELEKATTLSEVVRNRNVGYLAIESESLRTDERAQFERMQNEVQAMVAEGLLVRDGGSRITKGHRHRAKEYDLQIYRRVTSPSTL